MSFPCHRASCHGLPLGLVFRGTSRCWTQRAHSWLKALTHPPHLMEEQSPVRRKREPSSWGLPALLGIRLLCLAAGSSWGAGCSIHVPLTRSFSAQSGSTLGAHLSCVYTSHAFFFWKLVPGCRVWSPPVGEVTKCLVSQRRQRGASWARSFLGAPVEWFGSSRHPQRPHSGGNAAPLALSPRHKDKQWLKSRETKVFFYLLHL